MISGVSFDVEVGYIIDIIDRYRERKEGFKGLRN